MYEVDYFDSSTVQLVSQCKLPTKQLHDLKWPAFVLTAFMLTAFVLTAFVLTAFVLTAFMLAT